MIGRHINNYEITGLLGEGGMGVVYLAQHSFMGRKAAVKVLHPDLARNETLTVRFMNEARAANAIRHPNIIDIIDVGILPEDGTPFLMMEFLEGETLATRLERTGRLALESALDFAAQTASALAAAHAQQIVHRDLKPDNLFLVPDQLLSRGERVKILDFGIAKLRKDIRGNSDNTQGGTLLGTVMYMSPEQCQGVVDNIDARSDIYSLGIILYEMLAGAPPFTAEGFADVLIAHITRVPPSLRERDPAIPEPVAALVARCLAKRPEDRFPGMPDLLAALAAAGSYVPTPTPVHLPVHLPPREPPTHGPIRAFPQAGLDHISTQAVTPRKNWRWLLLIAGAAIGGVILAILVSRTALEETPAAPARETPILDAKIAPQPSTLPIPPRPPAPDALPRVIPPVAPLPEDLPPDNAREPGSPAPPPPSKPDTRPTRAKPVRKSRVAPPTEPPAPKTGDSEIERW